MSQCGVRSNQTAACWLQAIVRQSASSPPCKGLTVDHDASLSIAGQLVESSLSLLCRRAPGDARLNRSTVLHAQWGVAPRLSSAPSASTGNGEAKRRLGNVGREPWM